VGQVPKKRTSAAEAASLCNAIYGTAEEGAEKAVVLVERFPQGLKPALNKTFTARLKPRPFKTGTFFRSLRSHALKQDESS
jgi:hypothetical protein